MATAFLLSAPLAYGATKHTEDFKDDANRTFSIELTARKKIP